MESISISNIIGREILDSRGNPTVEVDLTLSNGSSGRASVPSGASTGRHEAVELRDGDDRFGGKGVLNAVSSVNDHIKPVLVGQNPFNQQSIDRIMIDLDNTPNKANLGANAILAVSLACAKAAANSQNTPLHDYIAKMADTSDQQSLPLPMMNVMNGGQHASGSTDIQEYMIIPKSAKTIQQAVEMGANVFHALAKVLKKSNYMTTVGDEGGYAPNIKDGNEEPLVHIQSAIEQAGYKPGVDFGLALDVAASELYRNGYYVLSTEQQELDSAAMIKKLDKLSQKYPLVSIEDGLDEDDWEAWQKLTFTMGGRVQLVGDDLLVTNKNRLERAIKEKSANAILIKPNQIGTLTETIEAVMMAKHAGWETVISHRSGETEDTSIAHIAVGLGAGQIKTGSLSRTDRVAKYNELMRIAEAAPHLKLAQPFRG
ncbi:phosphopyruvate hydratase [Candidatus Saccharibacteria bacterium]|jgi:enolase|nr:phosphopyruvate hydratase [Candidatus Saccharibacteria bacterium]